MTELLRRNWIVLLIIAIALGGWAWVHWLGWEHRQEPYTLIEDGLYVGASVAVPPPGTEAVLNLCDRKDPYRAKVHRQEFILDGGKPPSVDWLREMVDFVHEQRRAGRTTYIHCNAGISRSGLVATAYLMDQHNWGRDEALRFIRSKRPMIDPNPHFRALLLEWEKAREKGPTS